MGASDLVPGVTREADLGPAVSFPGPGARPLSRIIENKHSNRYRSCMS